jgi:hypothetical protein
MVKTMDLSCQALQSIRAAAPGALIVARAFIDPGDYQFNQAGARALFRSYYQLREVVKSIQIRVKRLEEQIRWQSTGRDR